MYSFGEPSSDAHHRMKVARWLMGKFPSPKVRRPLRDLKEAEVSRIRKELDALELIPKKERAAAMA